jgi:asparagine N-glycosylation enzyme membrane subunit Stt3
MRSRALLGIVWTLAFGVLAFSQVRYANDYAAAGCVGAALGITQLAHWLSMKTAASWKLPVAALLGIALIAPTWPRYYSILLEPSIAMAGQKAAGDRALLSLQGTQLRFAESVREATPESIGCGPEPGVPAYGILAHPAIGHVLHYVARRATPADPFGPYIGQENFDSLQRAWRSTSEQQVVEIAERLQARYVLSASDASSLTDASVLGRLHRNDGSAEQSLPQLGRFRLLAEGPPGGVSLAVQFEEKTRATTPYKLFEIVPGALLSVPAPAGERATALVSVRSPSGRRFSYRAESIADAHGEARLRVPYATGPSGRAASGGPYTVVAGDRRYQVAVPEAAVLTGSVIPVDAPGNRRN